MSDPSFEYHEIVQIGQDAARTLKSPAFNMAYEAVLKELQTRIFNTEPGHTKTLEEIRRQGNSLAMIIKKLQVAVAQAEGVIQQQHQQSEAPR